MGQPVLVNPAFPKKLRADSDLAISILALDTER
jgi:hypothetical protein